MFLDPIGAGNLKYRDTLIIPLRNNFIKEFLEVFNPLLTAKGKSLILKI